MTEYTRPATWDDVRVVTRLLEEHGAEYALIGGYAIAAHGYVRFSEDVDVLVNPSAGRLFGMASDARKKRDKPGVGKAYMFMVRLKLPGGKMSGTQYMVLDDIAGERANGTLRLTTRQSIQFHGIIKKDLRPAIQGMNAAAIVFR